MTTPGGDNRLPDWRDADAYGYTAGLTRRDWAWEYLRRNPAFRRDLLTMLDRLDWRETERTIDIGKTVDLSSWGIMFCNVAHERRTCDLASSSQPLCDAAGRGQANRLTGRADV